MCIRETEDIRPLRLPRTYELSCQLCDQSTQGHIDLVAHGEPRLFVCGQH
ncbi:MULTISPECIES: hypothetical protein [Streptomyces]